MIAGVCEENRGQFIRACAAGGFWEARLPVDQELYGKSPASGWQFFAAPGGALALRPGGSAVVCGSFDPEELGGLLSFLGVERVTLPESHPAPEGYQPGETITCFATRNPLPLPENTVGWKEERELPPQVGAGLLGGLDEEARMNFYADCCTRRNHGHGFFWGAMVEETAVTTVSTCALREGWACMFAGETLPEWRGKGIGGGLIVSMANHWQEQGKIPCFAARSERVHFYTRLGFEKIKYYKEYIYKG